MRWTLRHLTGPDPATGVVVVAAVVALLALLWWTVRQRQPLPLLLYSAIFVALSLTTHHYFGSKPR